MTWATQTKKFLPKCFFYPKKKFLILTKIIINISNEKISHACLRTNFPPKENILYTYLKNIFSIHIFLIPARNNRFYERKKFLYLPEKKQFLKEKISYTYSQNNFSNKKLSYLSGKLIF